MSSLSLELFCVLSCVFGFRVSVSCFVFLYFVFLSFEFLFLCVVQPPGVAVLECVPYCGKTDH